jgi:hypothetical protein
MSLSWVTVAHSPWLPREGFLQTFRRSGTPAKEWTPRRRGLRNGL